MNMREKGNNGKYACLCCGYATLEEPSSYEICEICFWEDDGQDDPNADECWGGPNHVSLTNGRRNFKSFGASELKDLKHVRKPSSHDEKIRDY
jgi:hypothetical protein